MSSHDISEPNDQLVLVVGYSATGKSASLRNIKNQDKWLYLNTEAGKRLPFRNQFQSFRITDPYQVHEAFDHGTNKPEVEGIIVDSLTFLMDMYETQYVIPSTNTMKAWGEFAQFYKVLMQEKVTLFGKPTIFTAHVVDTLDEKNMEMRTSVPVKGSLKNNGLEAYFSTVVSTKKVPIKEMEKFGSKLLTITDEERELGFKHVFQTRPTKTTTGERIRSPMGMFSKEQTYVDNDTQILLDHLKAFYK
jgi:hypothetical protein